MLTYLVLTIIYQSYLGRFDASKQEVDAFTQSVANQTETVLHWFNPQSYTAPNPNEPSVKLFYHDTYVSRVVEGCNALSIVILFVSFVVAFTGKFKKTIVFILFGCVLIHLLNITRIAFLSIALYHFPEYEHILHGVIFPLIIYGVVFILWVIWVNKFSLHAAISAKK